MFNYQVGDRVVLITELPTRKIPVGTVGTVIKRADIQRDYDFVDVCWDGFKDGWTPNGNKPIGSGWSVPAGHICLFNEKEKPVGESHYQTRIQPIETMQANMSPEEFQGFCKGNIIKYACRCGKKDAPLKEAEKLLQYAKWLVCSLKGEIINPHKEGGMENSSSKEKN